MFGHDAPMTAPSGSNLRRILVLRGFVIGGLLLAGVLAVRLLELPLPLPPLFSVIGLLTLVNLLTWWRLRQPWPVADGEFFAQLLVDVLAITVLLYYAGGSTNPLVSYYLVPLVIAAITLPAAYTWSHGGTHGGLLYPADVQLLSADAQETAISAPPSICTLPACG